MGRGIFAATVGALAVATAVALTAGAQETGLLDAPEQEAMTDTVQHALEYNPTQQAAEWVNPDSGRSGAVTPTRTFENAQGQPCREFTTTIIIGGKEEQGYGTACRQPDGSWQIVSEDRQAVPQAPAAAPQQVYTYAPPAEYYAYPSGFYGPYPIYLSFSWVYRSGSVHRGRRYLDGREFRHRYPLTIRERVFVGPRVYDHYRWREHSVRERHWQRDERRDRGGDRGGDRGRDRGERGNWGDRGPRGDRGQDRGRGWPDPDRSPNDNRRGHD
jgi:surface antigen